MFYEVNPVLLKGENVRLEPLSQDHAQGLFNRGQEVADWEFMPRACFVDMADTRQWIDQALEAPNQVPFAIVETSRDKAVGSTRFLNIRPDHRSLEIGWTWLGREWQGTAVNTQAKSLLLEHAFDRLRYLRVAFKTDGRNLRSQKALERIGANLEGVLRNHMIVQGDYSRDSVYYSVIDREWKDVKERLASLRKR
ncbi:MAG: RimJ/RimL family protein N-acetyltransferase [Halioglobus sp.]|jgi:RimJ/RimL family protein N-acetyltransferase